MTTNIRTVHMNLGGPVECARSDEFWASHDIKEARNWLRIAEEELQRVKEKEAEALDRIERAKRYLKWAKARKAEAIVTLKKLNAKPLKKGVV